ncbi:MAG: hypothetical protein ACK5F7_19705, partial [Planctomycetaceae bacterium]
SGRGGHAAILRGQGESGDGDEKLGQVGEMCPAGEGRDGGVFQQCEAGGGSVAGQMSTPGGWS